MTIYVRSIYVL